jgi:hypothetical protein
MTTIAKIRIKVGTMELEYEGDSTFLTIGIDPLLEKMGGLLYRMPDEVASIAEPTKQSGLANSADQRTSDFSTSTIASYAGGKTGPQLLICAMAHLEIVQSKQSSTRSEILGEMKKASGYYLESMNSNLSTTLDRLTKTKKIHKLGTEKYVLNVDTRKEIEGKLAPIT